MARGTEKTDDRSRLASRVGRGVACRTWGERQLRLFILACCDRIRHVVREERCLAVLAGLERAGEGELSRRELKQLQALAVAASHEIEAPLRVGDEHRTTPESCAVCALVCATNPEFDPAPAGGSALSSAAAAASYSRGVFSVEAELRGAMAEAAALNAAESAVQATLLRDIVGQGEANVGVGFEMEEDEESVKFMEVGVRCVKCGRLGYCAGWEEWHRTEMFDEV